MKEYLADPVCAAPTSLQTRNVVREYLQARILEAMQRAEAMVVLAFHGGTALKCDAPPEPKIGGCRCLLLRKQSFASTALRAA